MHAGAVCGTDGKSYSSMCTLIQSSPQTQVAHNGECNRRECTTSGEVGEMHLLPHPPSGLEKSVLHGGGAVVREMMCMGGNMMKLKNK
jgi:hypothetical protein